MVQVAEVVVDVAARQLDRTLDYLVPPTCPYPVQPGQRVFVPLAQRYVLGYVWQVRHLTAAPDGLKPLAAVLDERPLLTAELLDLAAWLCERWLCTRREALQAMLPAAYRLEQTRQYRARAGAAGALNAALWQADAERVWQALQQGPLTFAQLLARYGPGAAPALEQLLAAGWAEEVWQGRDAVREKTVTWVEAAVAAEELAAAQAQRARRAPRQAALLAELLARGPALPVQALGVRASEPALKQLVAAGLVRLRAVAYERRAVVAAGPADVAPPLTTWQQRAVDQLLQSLAQRRFAEFVLHGVTGSGKTEVYLQTIARCLAEGGGALVLVPEIALTPQLVQRFIGRFGEQVAVLHSALSAGERRDEWLRVRRGQARVVVGARSAVFAPVQGLRLVIVDEEHEPTYKQADSPRYDARAVARWRMERAGGTLVYGSATPSLAAMGQVEQGRAHLLVLPQRANGRPLPPVQVVDMRAELRAGNRSLFSRAMAEGLAAAVAAGRQAILFLNRRGYAAFLICRHCGELLRCRHCDISLTLHRKDQRAWLQCHYCGSTAPAPAVCPACAEPALRPYGAGTQQVEQAVRERWPTWRVLRMDVDTTRRKGAHQALIEQFARGDADVLIGTQMVAKGLDFPNVVFVGVVSADTMLAVPDFQAAERTFNLLTQVAGRSGRADAPGQTVVQTYQPEHYAIQAAARHDYRAFYEQERKLRATFQYPPFCELAVFVAMHPHEHVAASAARRFERELRRRLTAAAATVWPAAPAGVGRVEDRYRYQVVVKYVQWTDVRTALRTAWDAVDERLRALGGTAVLDVGAARIG
ncbi:MAG: primosomal protein N' [Alicyclobacillus sp.]|nr:primosomal protein N' [Alicyclobacillus sp.]